MNLVSEEKFIQLNIAFRMPENVAQEAMKLSREIAEKEDAYFVLDGVEYFPHATNYAVEFPEKNLDKVVQAVEELSVQFSPLEICAIENIADQGWVGVYFVRSQQFKEIHTTFVEKLSPLRESRVREKFGDIGTFSSNEERENIKNFGHPWVFDLYNPHLTITKLKDEKRAEIIAKEMIWPIEKFEVDTVGVFVSGKHGTCRKLLREFRLGVK